MGLTETYSRVWVGKNVSDRFPIRNGLNQGDALGSIHTLKENAEALIVATREIGLEVKC